MSVDRIWVDFNEFDPSRRAIPISKAAIDEFELSGQKVHEGTVVRLLMEDLDDAGNRDDLISEGIAHFSSTSGCWFAVGLGEIRHASAPEASPRTEDHVG